MSDIGTIFPSLKPFQNSPERNVDNWITSCSQKNDLMLQEMIKKYLVGQRHGVRRLRDKGK